MACPDDPNGLTGIGEFGSAERCKPSVRCSRSMLLWVVKPKFVVR
jgi:hypothetical protein